MKTGGTVGVGGEEGGVNVYWGWNFGLGRSKSPGNGSGEGAPLCERAVTALESRHMKAVAGKFCVYFNEVN